MNTADQHDFLSPRRGPAPLTPTEFAEQLATTHPQLRVHPDAPLIGGMGAVYRATLTTAEGQHEVAIKVLHWHLMDDPAFTARFQREQTLLRQLDHPNIVKLRDIGHTAEGLPFLVMDWIAGRSLTEFTQPGSTTDRQQLLRIADDLCAATQYAHDQGILHRDLKPQNIIVTQDHRAIVFDFGIARSLRPGHTLTQPGDAPGTHGYIAPEVLAGEKPDARADIYSLGIIIYQLLMKQLPHIGSKLPSDASLDPRFDAIFRKAVADREDRFQSAIEFSETLGLLKIQPPPVVSSNQNSPLKVDLSPDRVVINDLVLTHQTGVEDLIEMLGTNYDVTKFESLKESSHYWWPDVGLGITITNDLQDAQARVTSIAFKISIIDPDDKLRPFVGRLTSNGCVIDSASDPFIVRSELAVYGIDLIPFQRQGIKCGSIKQIPHPSKPNDFILLYEDDEVHLCEARWETPESIGKKQLNVITLHSRYWSQTLYRQGATLLDSPKVEVVSFSLRQNAHASTRTGWRIQENLLANETVTQNTAHHWSAYFLPPFFLHKLSTEFAVTDQRVLMRRKLLGLFLRQEANIALSKISRVDVVDGVLNRILGTGSVVIYSGDGAGETFQRIANPRAFRDAIWRAKEALESRIASAASPK